MKFLVTRIPVEEILGMGFLPGQKYMLHFDKGVLEWRGDATPLVNKNGRLLANKVQVLQPATLPSGLKAQVCSRLTSELSRTVGLVENSICGANGVAVAATSCQLGKSRCILVQCINVTAQPLDLRADSLIGIFSVLDEGQIVESNSAGSCASI